MMVRALGLVALTGCILPPPIEEGSDVENQPPKLITLSPNPTTSVPKVMSVLCPQYAFRATAVDPDPGDTIYWRYFIDYKNDLNPLTSSQPEEAPPDSTNPGGPRTLLFFPDPNDPRFGEEADKYDQPHTVEILIADRPFVEIEVDPVARAVEDGGLTDLFSWAVELIPTADPGCASGGS